MDSIIIANNIAKTMTILPRLMHFFMGEFKPQCDMPLKKNEIKTLMRLSISPNMPMNHYVDAVGMESGSFTYLANNLQKKGLLQRDQSSDDKRKTVLSLTDMGSTVAMQVRTDFKSHISNLISSLDEDTLNDLGKSLSQLEIVLEKLEQSKK